MRHGLLSLVLFVCSAAVASEPVIGPELPVSPYAIGTAVGGKATPVVLTNGKDFLIVWADQRSGHLAVYATRIASTGEEFDRQPILLLQNAAPTPWGAVMKASIHGAWDGSAYLIGGLVDTNNQWFRARVTPAGDVSLIPTGYAPPPVWPYNTQGQTVAVGDDKNGHYVYFVDTDGQWRNFINFPDEYPIAFAPLENGEWTIVLHGAHSVRWVHVRNDGTILGSKTLISELPWSSVTAAASGLSAAALTISDDGYPMAQRTFRWGTLDSAGKVKGGVAARETANIYVFQPESAGSVSGDTFHFAYSHGAKTATELRAFDTHDGNADELSLDGPGFQARLDHYYPSLASSATHTLLAWVQPCVAASACHVGMRLYPNGGSVKDVPTRFVGAGSVIAQDAPSAAAGGLVTAWREVDVTVRIRARVGGRVLTVAETEYGTVDVSAPRVAATRGELAVAWVETERVAGYDDWTSGFSRVNIRRFAADGTPIDAVPVRVGLDNTIQAFDIASRGNGFEVVWLADGVAAIRYVPASGSPNRTWRYAPTHPTLKRLGIAAASTAENVAVVWTEILGDAMLTDLVGVRVDASGEVSTPMPLDRAKILPDVRLAASDRELVVVTVADAAQTGCVHADRYTFNFLRIGPMAEAFCHELGTAPEAASAWDGANWWIALSNAENGLRAATFDGAVVELAPRDTNGPVLTPIPGGVAAVYARRDADAGMVSRVFARTLYTISRGRAVRH